MIQILIEKIRVSNSVLSDESNSKTTMRQVLTEKVRAEIVFKNEGIKDKQID